MEEEGGVIEPLSDQASSEVDLSSDYDPSLDGDESIFRSVSTSVNEHVYEYGRRYHTFQQGRYPLPNDEQEHDREAFKHVMLKEMMGGKLHLAPIGDNPQKIVDLGTGFGDWAIDVAEIYPSAQVIGVDLSPIQPAWVPPNMRFVVDDIEDEASWVHGNDLDFVHVRFVINYLKDVSTLARNIHRSLKPGAWVEVHDVCYRICSDDGSVPEDWAPIRFINLVRRIFEEGPYGFNLGYVETFHEILADQGFHGVHRRAYKVPIGGWPKDPTLNSLGRMWKPVLADFFAAVSSKPFIEDGMDTSEIAHMLQECQAALDNRRVHAYMYVYSTWAQKPA